MSIFIARCELANFNEAIIATFNLCSNNCTDIIIIISTQSVATLCPMDIIALIQSHGVYHVYNTCIVCVNNESTAKEKLTAVTDFSSYQ